MKGAIEKELEYFESHEQELIEKYLNKFIVIRDCTVEGAYDSDSEAYNKASKKFKDENFLIRQCLKDRKPLVFYSRVRV